MPLDRLYHFPVLAVFAFHGNRDHRVDGGDEQNEDHQIEQGRERLPIEQQRERRQEDRKDVDHRRPPQDMAVM